MSEINWVVRRQFQLCARPVPHLAALSVILGIRNIGLFLDLPYSCLIINVQNDLCVVLCWGHGVLLLIILCIIFRFY